ncbi:MAG: cap-binding protein [Desulfotomaculum sp.]|nr:cap-binding protein [Desulfotomaculum sp.]
MTVLEAIKKWEKDTTVYLHYNREMKNSEYNQGFADGLEAALASLKSYLKDCTDYKGAGGKD